jgi:WD40 repeat protein
MPQAQGRLVRVVILLLTLSLLGGEALPAAERGQGPKKKKPVHTDLFGDPLPLGALARLGTTRLRHGDRVYCAAFSPDGKALASGGNDNAVSLWNVAAGRTIWHYRGQQGYVGAVAFSPDGRMVASGSADGTVHVLDAATGKLLFILQGRNNRVTSVAFSPDGKILASGSGYGTSTVVLWQVASRKELRRLNDSEGPVLGVKDCECTEFRVAFSADGKTLVSSWERRTLLWDVATGKIVRKLTPKEKTWCIAYSPDGKAIATGNADGLVHLWEATTGKEIRRLRGHRPDGPLGSIYGVGFSPDSKRLVSAGGDQTLRLWEVATGKEIRRFAKDTGPADFCSFSSDGRTVASGSSSSNRVRFWDAATGKQMRLFAGHQDALTTLAFCPDGRMLVTGGDDDTIRIWQAQTGKELLRFQEVDQNAQALAVSPNGNILACGGNGKAVRFRNLKTGKEVLRLPASATRFSHDSIRTLAFSPDGKTLVSRGSYETRLWDVAGGKAIHKFDGYWHAVAFSGNGQLMAFAKNAWPEALGEKSGWRIQIRNAATGNFVSQITREEAIINRFIEAIAFSPDGRFLATAGDERPIQFWEVATGKECFALKRRQERIESIAFSPDGKILASGDAEGVIYLWEVSTGKVRRRFKEHQGNINSLAFSPDGKLLASASSDCTALVWDVTCPIPDHNGEIVACPTRDFPRLWKVLAGNDAAKADDAIRKLIATPKGSVRSLQARLRAVPASMGQRIARLIRKLDSDRFPERQRASVELEKFQELAEPALRKALANRPTPEVRRRAKELLAKRDGRISSADLLRAVRAIEVLEHINTPEARQVLSTLAKGSEDSRITREAKASLERLAKRRKHRTGRSTD